MIEFFEKLDLFSPKRALIFGGASISYSDLMKKIHFVYNQIQNSIPEKKVVLLKSGLTPCGIATFFALTKNKNVIVPATEIPEQEIKTRISISGAEYKILIEQEDFKIEKLDFVKTDFEIYQEILSQNHPGLVLFSSGMTGIPKGMVHDLFVLMKPFLNKKEKNTNLLAMLLFDHIGGINTIFSTLFSGATLTIPETRDPVHICKEIEKHQVNVLPASPTILNLILLSGAHKRFDLKSLRLISYGTEPMPEGLLKRLNEAFPRVRFLQTFGTSETGISQIASESSKSTGIKFDDPNTEFKVVDGELWLRSKTMIKGYLNASMEQFTEDGWFKTGDLAEINEKGYLRIKGRKSGVINVGGLKVLPQEVESALMEIPFISNCLVYGENNPITGNIVVAKVTIDKKIEESSALKDIRAFLRKKLDRYKIPVKIHFVDSIEYNSRFKKLLK